MTNTDPTPDPADTSADAPDEQAKPSAQDAAALELQDELDSIRATGEDLRG